MAISQYHVSVCVWEKEQQKRKSTWPISPKNYATYRCYLSVCVCARINSLVSACECVCAQL